MRDYILGIIHECLKMKLEGDIADQLEQNLGLIALFQSVYVSDWFCCCGCFQFGREVDGYLGQFLFV
jgi:hypothetical protein